jgi:hypothetical protein
MGVLGDFISPVRQFTLEIFKVRRVLNRQLFLILVPGEAISRETVYICTIKCYF